MATVKPSLLVIVGETASGKTALAIELAQKLNGEIICADSRTIYRGMDIGTAKPTKEERAVAKHHMLDIRDPNEPYSAADFQHDAKASIADIAGRGKLPILVGGSGLYVDAVIYDYDFSDGGLKDDRNPRHLAPGTGPQNRTLRPGTVVIGVARERNDLTNRITARAQAMLNDGLIAETEGLISTYGRPPAAFSGTCYRLVADYLAGALSREELLQKMIRADMVLAKKQRTWFRRNKSIHWLDNRGDAVAITTTLLNNLAV